MYFSYANIMTRSVVKIHTTNNENPRSAVPGVFLFLIIGKA